jgi:hypothetical protein
LSDAVPQVENRIGAADDAETDSIYVERGNFEQVPDVLWMHGAVSPRAVVLYLALSKRGGRNDRGVPKRSTLAKDMGVSVRTVDNAIDELIEKGWLLITPRRRLDADQGQTSNNYRLMWTPIQAADDPRLVAHQKQVDEFNQHMVERQAANAEQGKNKGKDRSVRATAWKPPVQETARGEGAENCTGARAGNCAPPVQETAPLPVQKTAPQESDLLKNTPSTNQTTTAEPLRDPTDEGDQPGLFIVDGATDGASDTRAIGAKERDSTARDLANRWISIYEDKYSPITGRKRVFFSLRTSITDALEAGYTVEEIQQALLRTNGPDKVPEAAPDKPRFQRALVAVRTQIDNQSRVTVHQMPIDDPDRQRRANAW